MNQSIFTHLFLLASMDDYNFYRCPKCNALLVVSNDPDDPWQYKDGKWEHNCNQPK